jgi:ParB/RepB/Spo0J family partition protein
MSETNANFAEAHFGKIPLACVVPSATNPRKTFTDAGLEQLAASIKEHGVRQPILVRPLPTTTDMINPVEIVAGERRYRAAKMAGLVEIPAIVQDLSDSEARELQLVENCQREDVPEIEEADGFERLMKDHGYTAEQLAKRIGMSKSHVYARLKLCALSPDARETLLQHGVSTSVSLLVARIPVPKLQELAAVEVSTHNGGEPMSYRRAAAHIQERYNINLDRARFSIKDAKLVPSAGSCSACPNRTGNQPEVFADVGADICTDPNCFASKTKAHEDKTITSAQKKGIPVHEGKEATEFVQERDDLVIADSRLYNFERYKTSDYVRPVEDMVPADLLPKPQAFVRVNGKVQAMYDRNAMQQALEKAGICETVEQAAEREKKEQEDLVSSPKTAARKTQDDERRAREKVREAAAEQETKARLEAYLRIRRSAGNGLSVELFRATLKTMLGQFHHGEYNLPDDLMRDVYTFDTSSEEAIWSYIDQAPLEELQLLLMDTVFGQSIDAGYYAVKDDGSLDEEDGDFLAITALTEVAGISLADVRAELTPEKIETPDAPEASTASEATIVEKPAKGKGRKNKKTAAGTFEADPASTTSAASEDATVELPPLPPSTAWPFPTSAERAEAARRAALAEESE